MTEPVPLYTVRGKLGEIDWLGYVGDTVKVILEPAPDAPEIVRAGAAARHMCGVILAARRYGDTMVLIFEGGPGAEIGGQPDDLCTLTVRDREAEAADRIVGGIGRVFEQFGGAGPFG